jgi:hypothetical protein
MSARGIAEVERMTAWVRKARARVRAGARDDCSPLRRGSFHFRAHYVRTGIANPQFPLADDCAQAVGSGSLGDIPKFSRGFEPSHV